MAPQVKCADQARHQQQRREFDSDPVSLEQSYTDLLRTHCVSEGRSAAGSCDTVAKLYQQDQAEKRGAKPVSGAKPLTFHFHGVLCDVEHHHDKYEEHHDGARIDHDLKRCHKRGAESIESLECL